MTDETVYTQEINGVKYNTCEENDISYTIHGENTDFPCMGHSLDIYPSDTDVEGFREIIDSKMDMLFGDSARGLNLEATLYLPRADWWVYVQILYEYAI